jgi:hypothetical protein
MQEVYSLLVWLSWLLSDLLFHAASLDLKKSVSNYYLIILENLFRVQGLIGCRLPVKKDGGLLVFPVRNASVFTSVIAAVPQFVVYCHRHLVFVVEYSGYSLLLFLLFLLFNGSFFSFSFLTSVLYRV